MDINNNLSLAQAFLNGGEQQPDQNTDNRNNDEQLDERKTAFGIHNGSLC